jgi:hypothetical protein
MGNLKQDLHDRLWNAQHRWFALREQGETKHELKMRGLRECGDANRYLRNLIFADSTRLTYEKVLKDFVDYAEREHGCQRLEVIGKREFRGYMNRAIDQGQAARTLNLYRSALAKLGALTGKSESANALSRKYGVLIRELAKTGAIAAPTRPTPDRQVLNRAIAVLKSWDARHFARMDEPRAYHLAARLQLETAARSVSATERVTRESILDGNRVRLIGKGGKEQTFSISLALHGVLTSYLAQNPGPLAPRRGYQSSYARAILAVGGQVPGTHGARRRAVRDKYTANYRSALESGLAPQTAAAKAAGDAIETLGHSRNRRDHRRWYLGR